MAIKQDIPALILLCREHADFENTEYDLINQETNLIRDLFSNYPKLFCWVVEDALGKLTGYCSYTLEYSTWTASCFIHMDCLYLQPEARKQQLGKLLMKKMVAHARELKVSQIQWQTPDTNENAIGFYKKIGASAKPKIRFFLNTEEFNMA
jgi:ribosomal protein S18 acetylase RimI-like enzyme